MWREGSLQFKRRGECTPSPLIPLTEIASLHDRSDMHFSFNMSLSPSAFATETRCAPVSSDKKISAEETSAQKKREREKNRSASAVCNAICCFRWQRVSKWESCEVSGF